MKIYNSIGAEILDIQVSDNSYAYKAIQETASLTLYFSSTEFIEIPLGAYCQFQGETFYLNDPSNFKKNGTRNFEYTLILESVFSNARRYKIRNISDGRLKFSLTAKPADHLQLIVDNMNLRDAGWAVGNCIDSTEKVLNYNHIYTLDALRMIAEEFNTEWEVEGKTIHLRRTEYNKETPLPLSYGKGNGFRPGVGRINMNDTRPVEILYVQGGERNIDFSKYSSKELLLPKNQQLVYNGRTYQSDADGLYIKRADKAVQFNNEDSLDLSHIYPSRVGVISSVVVVDAAKNFYDVIDNSIPDNLNYSNYRIAGEKATIVFQTGMLAGREFDIEQTDNALTGYVHAERRFKIVPQEIDGVMMPDATFKPAVGDKYAIFNISLPDTYICDNATKQGASWDMFREAAKYLNENEDNKFSFTGELDGIWAKQNWLAIEGKIKPGGYISFSDAQFQADGVLVRITSIKQLINNPFAPVIELSNASGGSGLGTTLQKIDGNDVKADRLNQETVKYAKRGFRDSKQTANLLASAMQNFGNSINPLTIQTMSMLVGDESLQFRFVDDMVTPDTVVHNVSFDSNTKVLTSPAGIIQHMTLGINSISPVHDASEYKFWVMPAFNSNALDGSKSYYLYAKVSRTNQTGNFLVSETAIGISDIANYYHLLVGILNPENDKAERSYVDVYGFSEILPGRIMTDRIVSGDGTTTIDLSNGFFMADNTAPGDKYVFGVTKSAQGGKLYPKLFLGERRTWDYTDANDTAGGFIVERDTEDNKYKFHIGDRNNYLNYDGSNLRISGATMSAIVDGVPKDLYKVVNGVLLFNVPIASSGNITAYSSDTPLVPSVWEGMPIASATILGGIKLGENLTYNPATGKVDAQAGGLTSVDWSIIQNKPATFTPSVHTHAYSSLTGLPTLFSGSYIDLTNKPDLSFLPLAGGTMTGVLNMSNSYYNGEPATRSQQTNKIRLYGDTDSLYYGFGVSSSSLNYSVPDADAKHRFWVNNSEVFRIDANGAKVNGNTVWNSGNLNNPISTGNYINSAGQADLQRNNTIFSYSPAGTPWSGTLLTVGGFTNGDYALQLNGSYGGNHLSFRNKNDDGGGGWEGWKEIWHSGNLNRSDTDFTGNNLISNQNFTFGWYRNYNNNTGLFNEANATGIYSDAWKRMRIYNEGELWVDNNIISSTTVAARNSIHSQDNGNGYLELGTYAGSLPGFPSSYYPTLKSNSAINFAANNTYIGAVTINGIEVNVGKQFQSYGNGFKSFNFYGLVGDYDQNGSTSKIIWTIGDNWNTINTHYGIGYQYNVGSDGFWHTYVFRDNGIVNVKISGTNGNIWGAGSLTMSGNITAYSDARLKTSFAPVRNVLSTLNNINAYTYTRIDNNNGKRHLGLIAQEVERYYPELVEIRSDGIRSLNYQNFTAVLLQAIKELRAEVSQLKERRAA